MNILFNPLSPEEEEKVKIAFAALHEVFDSRLKTLTTPQIRSAQKLGDKSLAFVDKCCDYMEKYPKLVPSYIDVATIRQRLMLMDVLRLYSEELTPLATGTKDSRIAIGMDIIHVCNSYYKSISIAAGDNVQQAKSIYYDLKTRYPGGKRKKDEESELG